MPRNSRKLEETRCQFPRGEETLVSSERLLKEMKEKNDLQLLRNVFVREVHKRRIRETTVTRYRSWIRRFLLHCRALGVSPDKDSALYFLRTYESRHSQRQGYFALKFLFGQRNDSDSFFTLDEIDRAKHRRSERWHKWWRKYQSGYWS